MNLLENFSQLLYCQDPPASVIFSIEPSKPSSLPTKSSIVACEEGPGIFAKAMALGSLLLVIFSLPVSLFFVVKVVQVIREGGREGGERYVGQYLNLFEFKSFVAEINLNAENF